MTVTEQNQERIDRQMQTITAQTRTIAEQAERISALYMLLQRSLEHAPEFVRIRTAERLREIGVEVQL